MKKLSIILAVLISMSCKKDNLELTGMEGKLVNQKGEVQKLISISYVIQEYKKTGLYYGGSGYYPITINPIKVIPDTSGYIKISEMLSNNQIISLIYNDLLYDNKIDTFYVKSPNYFNPNEMLKGKYYRDVIIVVKK